MSNLQQIIIVFHRAILQLMPIEDLGESFSCNFDRPTKEFFSVCGLILSKDYFGWTNEETIDHYLYDIKIQYALKRKFENFALDLSLASVNSMRILHYNPTFFRFLPTNDAPAFFNIFLISPEITPSCS